MSESTAGDGGQVNDQQPGSGTGATPAASTTGDGGQQTPGNQQSEPFAIFENADAFNKRMAREAKKQMNAAASALGFESWEQMQGVFRPNQTGDGGQQQQPGITTNAQGAGNEAERLRMALSIAQKMNIPAALIGRLQGDTPEDMEADAAALMALVSGQTPATPTQRIPSAPNQERAVTFTRTQLQDAAFVRANTEAIRAAAREGRIVNS